MEKLESRTYKGIDYIRLTELPDEQYLAFIEWIGNESIITIQVNGSSIKNCVQFSDYSYWYDSIFMTSENAKTSKTSRSKRNSLGFAFDN